MKKEITVLIADDHPIFRKGLRQIVEEGEGLKVVSEVADGELASQRLEELKPDVAVLDMDMPKMNGLEVARKAQTARLSTYLIVLTMHKEEDLFNEAMNLGVQGYVLKENAASDIVAAIGTVARGGHFISPSISGFLIQRSDRVKALEKAMPGLDSLTPTERKVLKLVGTNKTSKEIAEELSMSHKTVENHRTNIAHKLNVHGSHALLKFAIENKSLL
jgi:DNA-binding NarL/FixJ family response regulator